jgi:phenylacetate-CoA ligase
MPLMNEDNGNTFIKEIVGTSLYNYSMPLIRYKTGDYVKLKRSPEKCSCQRSFPSIVSIIGRDTDVIITPDRRAVTCFHMVFKNSPGIIMGQVIQEDMNHLLVKIVPASENLEHIDKVLIENIRDFVGNDMNIKIEYTKIDGIKKDKLGKFKTIISKIPYDNILSG